MKEIPIGRIDHVWPKARAAGLDLTGTLMIGDRVRIRCRHGHVAGREAGDRTNPEGFVRDFVEVVTSLEIDHAAHKAVGPGEDAAMHVDHRVHAGDEVYKLMPEHGWSVVSGGY